MLDDPSMMDGGGVFRAATPAGPIGLTILGNPHTAVKSSDGSGMLPRDDDPGSRSRRMRCSEGASAPRLDWSRLFEPPSKGVQRRSVGRVVAQIPSLSGVIDEVE